MLHSLPFAEKNLQMSFLCQKWFKFSNLFKRLVLGVPPPKTGRGVPLKRVIKGPGRPHVWGVRTCLLPLLPLRLI